MSARRDETAPAQRLSGFGSRQPVRANGARCRLH